MSVTYTNGKVLLPIHKNASTWLRLMMKTILTPGISNNNWNASSYPTNSVITFVRNPWDRILSGYLYNKKAWCNPKWGQEKEYGPFPDFITYLKEIERAGGPYETKWQSFRRQADYIDVIEKDLFFLGRFETLKEDLKKVCDKMEVEMPKEEPSKRNESRGKEGGPFGYRDYYTEETKKIVENIYSADCIRFGYEF